MKCYVFGYGSLLATSSTASTTGNNNHSKNFIPARLYGYTRSWDAIRCSNDLEQKRYINPNDWSVIELICWSNIKKSADNDFLNGVCFEIEEEELPKLDYRETGYKRLNVSKCVSPYLGFSLNSAIEVFTYVDSNCLNYKNLPSISMDYVNMITLGAWAIDDNVDKFFSDFIASTHTPTAKILDIKQVYFDESGQNLFLLDEKDSSSILIHSFKNPQFFSKYKKGKFLLEPQNGVKGVSQSFEKDLLLVKSKNTSPDVLEKLSKHRNWLVRLICSDNPNITNKTIEALRFDNDNWVVRCAKGRKR